MNIRNDYEKKMQAQLDELKTRLEAFKEKINQEETNLQLEYYTLAEEVKLELEATHKELQLLKQVSDEKWEELKTDFEITWNSLQDLIKAITLP